MWVVVIYAMSKGGSWRRWTTSSSSKRERLRRSQLEMRAMHVLDPKLVARRKDAAIAHEQLVRRVIEYAVPAILRFQHQREG